MKKTIYYCDKCGIEMGEERPPILKIYNFTCLLCFKCLEISLQRFLIKQTDIYMKNSKYSPSPRDIFIEVLKEYIKK